MSPTQHISNNDVLRAPAGATIDECRPLAITRVRYGDGTPAVASYWRPSPEELRLLAGGGAVRLTSLGMTHPPVILGVEGDGEDFHG